MKRLTSFLMVCIMLLGMSAGAFAAGDENASVEGGYTAVTTSNERVRGFYNDNAALKVELAGRDNSGAMSADGGSLEIVQYNPSNGFAYAVSGLKGKLIAVNLNENMDGEKAADLSDTEYDLKEMLTTDNFQYGDMTSVAVSPDGSILAAAVQAENYADNGIVALFSCMADGTLDLINTAIVGVQPDMVTFADDNTILTADEGEPREGVSGTDPQGSVTIVTVEGNNLTANTVTFDSFDEKREELEAETNIEVFVINGNHDISNSHAVKFNGDTTESVATVNTEDFKEIYNDFGYAQAVAQDPNSLSYAADLGEDYRLIVMDACIYNNDVANPAQETRGEFKNETLNWVLAQIKAAIKDGRRPIGMLHHGLVQHTAIEPTMFSEYLVKDYETVAAKLADAGMNLVFTGHFHSQDAAMMTTKNGSVLYDVETGSLVTSPCPIRYVALNGDSFSYTATHVTKVAGYENFPEHAADFLKNAMAGLVDNMLPNALRALGVTDEAQIAAICSNENLKALLVGGFVAHYAGDETIDEATAA